MLNKAGVDDQNTLFRVLVKLGIFEENENIDLHRFDIETDFPHAIETVASDMVVSLQSIPNRDGRRDLTSLPVLKSPTNEHLNPFAWRTNPVQNSVAKHSCAQIKCDTACTVFSIVTGKCFIVQ